MLRALCLSAITLYTSRSMPRQLSMLDVHAARMSGIRRAAAGLRDIVSFGGEVQTHERHPALVFSFFALKEQLYAQF